MMRAVSILCLACVHQAGGQAVLLDTGFEADPAAAGWRGGVFGGPASGFAGAWATGGAVPGQHCLAVSKGMWESPAVPVTPFVYYRVSFIAKSARTGFRVANFLDAAGRQLPADDHDSLETAATWTPGQFFVQAREDATHLRVGFGAEGAELQVDDVRVTPVTRDEILAAGDELGRALPPLTCRLDPERWTQLPRTMQALREGRPLRLLLLGDSIVNDLGNSLFHLQLERLYPGAQITLLRSIRGGTGCRAYRRQVGELVIAKAPDLVIIGGISNDFDAAAVRSVVEQARKGVKKPVEFLVMTGASLEPGMTYGLKARGFDSPPAEVRQKAVADEAAFYAKLVEWRAEMRWATLDMRGLWEDYLAQGGRPRAWYQRDFVHTNARGRQLLSGILVQFFQPPPAR